MPRWTPFQVGIFGPGNRFERTRFELWHFALQKVQRLAPAQGGILFQILQRILLRAEAVHQEEGWKALIPTQAINLTSNKIEERLLVLDRHQRLGPIQPHAGP